MTARGTVRSIGEGLAELRELAHVERIVCASPVQITDGWALDGFHSDDVLNASKLRRLLASYLMRANGRFGWFDLQDPEPADRNVLVDLRQRVREDEFAASRICREVLRPLQLHRHHVIRSLICEGGSLLAWFAVIHPRPLTTEQQALIETALPALRRRLVTARRLTEAPVLDAALDYD